MHYPIVYNFAHWYIFVNNFSGYYGQIVVTLTLIYMNQSIVNFLEEALLVHCPQCMKRKQSNLILQLKWFLHFRFLFLQLLQRLDFIEIWISSNFVTISMRYEQKLFALERMHLKMFKQIHLHLDKFMHFRWVQDSKCVNMWLYVPKVFILQMFAYTFNCVDVFGSMYKFTKFQQNMRNAFIITAKMNACTLTDRHLHPYIYICSRVDRSFRCPLMKLKLLLLYEYSDIVHLILYFWNFEWKH